MALSISLNMIVKDEAARIERALESVAPFIDYWVICDTGSTDGTQDVIKKFFATHKIDGCIVSAPFEDWSQARNAALRAAKQRVDPDSYILLMDADMELRVSDRSVFDNLTGPSYDVYQQAGTMVYMNRRLVRAGTTGEYLGVTHEFLNVDSAGCLPKEKVYFYDHADGSNRPEKFKRDIRLLKAGLKKEPKNERYMYYIAQSYRDAGKLDQAIKWYKNRADFGGWAEEQWSAQMHMAQCMLAVGDEPGYIANMLKAYDMRPSRAEVPYQLAKHYREKGMNAPACTFAETAMQIPYSTDGLFVDDYTYAVGAPEEYGICAFYMPSKRENGFKVTDMLSLSETPYRNAVELARRNMYWYLPLLKDVAPSFEAKKIEFTTEPNWTALNPSVTNHKGKLLGIVRTVNYRLDNDGRYIIQGTDGTANDSNPINTRNFLVTIDDDLNIFGPRREVLLHGNEPCLFKPVIGYEDMRLFSRGDQLWTSSCVRQMAADGYCEQVMAQILQGEARVKLGEPLVMRKLPRLYEKNWAPIGGRERDGHQLFMYRLGEVVNDSGQTVVKHENKQNLEHISGGSQVIPFNDGWIALVHEARPLPNEPHKRYYYHRFAFFESDFKLKKLTLPFCFNDKLIEFAAGMCWHPDGQRLVLSYGFRDCEPWIGTVDHRHVQKMLFS